jgi:hypothetical protein
MGGTYPGKAQFQGQKQVAVPEMFQGMPQIGITQRLPQSFGQMHAIPQMPGMQFRKS